MSGATKPTTDTAAPAAPTPFTMVTGDPAAPVCEGDVCHVPGAPGEWVSIRVGPGRRSSTTAVIRGR